MENEKFVNYFFLNQIQTKTKTQKQVLNKIKTTKQKSNLIYLDFMLSVGAYVD